MKPLLACLVLPILTSSLFGQEPDEEKSYLLASENPPLPVGLTFKVTKNNVMKDFKTTIQVLGREKSRTMNKSDKKEVHLEYLSQDKIRMSFLKDRTFKKDSGSDLPEGEETIGVGEGKNVIFEKKEGVWTGKLEKGEIDQTDRAAFDEELKDQIEKLNTTVKGSVEIFGTKPRKIGEKWEVNPKKIPGFHEMEVSGGKVVMKFVKVKEFNGENCAVLKMDLDLTGRMESEDLEGMPVKIKGTMRTIHSMKYFTSYKSTGTMSMDVSGKMTPKPGVVASLSMNGDIELTTKMALIEQREK